MLRIRTGNSLDKGKTGVSNWKTVNLDEVCEICRGGSPRPIMNFITDREDGVNWIKIGDVDEGDKYISHTNEKIIPEGIKSSREVVSGDLILSNSMSFGRPYILQLDGCIHDGWLRIRNNSKILDKEYLYYFLCSSVAQNQFKSVATGSVVNNLKSDTVKAVKMKLPPLEVQVNIVKIMNNLDERIEINKKLNHHLTSGMSETDSSPDIRRGNRVSRRVARRKFSLRFKRTCSNKGAVIA